VSAFERRSIVVDGLRTSFLEAGVGKGDPLVLLHGGEFGGSAEFGWERNMAALAERHHVLAPDQLGYGHSAKVIDFTEGRRMRIRHVARFCEALGIESAGFVGNSMGGLNLLVDQTSEQPLLPVSRMVVISGGGEILRNDFSARMFEFDATFAGMRGIVEALFHDPAYAADDEYVRRRFESSIAPGAWEAIAAARFRRPDAGPGPGSPKELPFEQVTVRTLVVEGGEDKIKPRGWSEEIAERIPDASALTIPDAAHCPQIEQPDAVDRVLLDFFSS
jgi:pimeloyl-ACP methyl ester carboxylesterase